MASYTPVQLAFNCIEPDDCDKDKVPIIFIHGLTSSKETWGDITQTVADATKRKVYSIDSRNHGDSEWSDTFDFNCNECDLVNFMDSKKIPKAILVGHSMGGITSMKTALHKPERVEKLIVEDANVKRVPQAVLDLIKTFISVAKNALLQVPPGVDEKTAKKIISETVLKLLPPKLTLTSGSNSEQRFMLKTTADGRYTFKTNVDAVLKALDSQDLMEDHEGVYEGPVNFIYGKLSPFFVANDEAQIKQFFPNAELIGISGATHTVHSDCPKEFTDALLKCLVN